MESEVFYEKSGIGNMASVSCMITEWLSEAWLNTVIVSVHAFSLSLLAAMELVAAEQSKRRLGEGTEVAIVVKEQAFKVGSGVAETFGNQIIRVEDVFDLLPASERKADYVCIFLSLWITLQEHDFGTSKADDGRDMLVTPDTDIRLKQKEYSDWIVVAKKDDDDDDEDDDDEEEEDEDVEGEEEGGYDEGDAEEDDNADDNDAADDGDDEGDDDDGEGDGGDGDEDEDEEDDDEEYDDEEEEEEPPKKKTK